MATDTAELILLQVRLPKNLVKGIRHLAIDRDVTITALVESILVKELKESLFQEITERAS